MISGPLSCRVFRETGPRPGRRQRSVLKAWKQGVFGSHAGQCVCGLKMNKLISRTSHRLCTFSTLIREIREIKYYFSIWGIRIETRGLRKRGGGGENSPISPPLDPRLHTKLLVIQESLLVILRKKKESLTQEFYFFDIWHQHPLNATQSKSNLRKWTFSEIFLTALLGAPHK